MPVGVAENLPLVSVKRARSPIVPTRRGCYSRKQGAPQAAGLSGNYLNDVVSGTVETTHVCHGLRVEFALFARLDEAVGVTAND